MAYRNIATLKSFFKTGDFPTQAQFGDLLDTMFIGQGNYLYPPAAGVNDHAPAIQAAINALSTAGGGVLRAPSGAYRLLSTIAMRSGVSVVCDEGVRFDCDGFSGDPVTFNGTVEAEVALTAPVTRGDVQLTAASGFNVGDLLHLVSQRNAVGGSAGGYRLGEGTANSQYCYFAEWHRVAQKITATQHRLAERVIFPAYNTTASGEVDTARTSATVKRVTPCKDAAWIGGTFTRTVQGANIFSGMWAENCRVEGVRMKRGAVIGASSVRWSASINCETRDCVNENDPTLVYVDATHHGNLNRYKLVGCQDCRIIGCSDEYGAQSIDLTYSSAAPFANVRPQVERCVIRYGFEECTSHPGNYQERWEGNAFLSPFDGGLSMRGLQPSAHNNLFSGAYRHSNTGNSDPVRTRALHLISGHAKGASIKGNVIRGFNSAIWIGDGAAAEEKWAEVDCVIEENTVSDCFEMLRTTFDPSAALRGITVKSNHMSRIGRFGAYLDNYSAGVVFKDNVLEGDFLYDGAATVVALVYAIENCPSIVQQGTIWNRSRAGNPGQSKTLLYARDIDDTTRFPAATFAGLSSVARNEVRFGLADGVTDTILTQTTMAHLRFGPRLQNATIVAASATATVAPTEHGRLTVTLSNEGAAASLNLDQIVSSGDPFQIGDEITLRTSSNSQDVVIRDATALSIANDGFQTPSSASITLGDSSDIVVFRRGPLHWHLASSSDN